MSIIHEIEVGLVEGSRWVEIMMKPWQELASSAAWERTAAWLPIIAESSLIALFVWWTLADPTPVPPPLRILLAVMIIGSGAIVDFFIWRHMKQVFTA